MSEDHPGPFLVRARLRRDRPAHALARVLVPQEDGARLGVTHSLVWALFADHRTGAGISFGGRRGPANF